MMFSILKRLRGGLARSRETLSIRISGVLSHHQSIDDTLWEELEQILIESDVGVPGTERLIDRTREHVRRKRIRELSQVPEILMQEMVSILNGPSASLCNTTHYTGPSNDSTPFVIMMVGVNGSGKTTTIAKLARRYRKQGLSVLVAAADTYRAAAAEQLGIWAQRVGVEMVGSHRGADPASVCFDAATAAVSRGVDVLIVDTAGRMHTRQNLMNELQKMSRAIAKQIAGAPHQTVLVLDATTGQNGLSQAQLFHDAVQLSGVALCKLDGTARGGIVVAIAQELGLPVLYVGVGEGMDDLLDFDAQSFVHALWDQDG